MSVLQRWVVKWAVIHPDNGILPNYKEERAMKPRKEKNEYWLYIATWKNASLKKATYYMTLQKKQIYRGSNRSVVSRGLQGYCLTKGSPGWFRPWNYSVWCHNADYLTLCICQNPEHCTAERVHLTYVRLNIIFRDVEDAGKECGLWPKNLCVWQMYKRISLKGVGERDWSSPNGNEWGL